MRKIVVPGELLGKGSGYLPYVFEEGGNAYSAVYGLLSEVDNKFRVIPLQGKYIPAVEDQVVGIVTSVRYAGCTVDMNSPYTAFLPSPEFGPPLEVGDVISTSINEVDEVYNTRLEDFHKLSEGMTLEISPVKVPRVIGKQGSMIKMLKDCTGSEIIVGKNGRVWYRGGKTELLERVIFMIEREAHTSGLTDRVKDILEGKEEK